MNFPRLVFLDFEFHAPLGEPPDPICMVAVEHGPDGQRTYRLTQRDLAMSSQPPFPVGPETVLVSFYASAEIGCFLSLGWNPLAKTLDLYTEFRWRTSGVSLPVGEPTGERRRSRHSLLAAMAHFGLAAMAPVEKEAMRDLAMRGGPYTPDEERALLDYCEADVRAVQRLFEAMHSKLDWPRALLRGRYTIAVARMERTGIPLDQPLLVELRNHWDHIKARLIERVDAVNGIYEGHRFGAARWLAHVRSNGIPWPMLPSGQPCLDDESFTMMARAYPAIVQPYRDLRVTMSRLKLEKLAVGRDGRNRVLLSPFASTTGRNQPSTNRFIFGPAKWLRALIRPEPGMALAYVDFEQQEFGIAAALSGDTHMQSAYRSGDPYLTFAIQAGAAPSGATKASHGEVRERFKVCALAVQYGASAHGISAQLGQPLHVGEELLELHRRTYPVFWEWSQAVQDFGVLSGKVQSAFGWQVHVSEGFNPRSVRNFPCQANGAEMLRLACIATTEAGIRVCAPIHDALLVEAPVENITQTVALTQHLMARASEAVLPGFPLRTEAKVISRPDRFMDTRGEPMWQTVQAILTELGQPFSQDPPHPCVGTGSTGAAPAHSYV